jgi:hypothetical protein
VIPVVADAETLFGATTRGLPIHLDFEGLIRLHWSPLILDEMSCALVDTGRKPDAVSVITAPDGRGRRFDHVARCRR